MIAYKSSVTIWCQGRLDAQLYVLHKQGSPKLWGTESTEEFGEKAKFFIPSVTKEHVGQYQCYCYTSAGWSEHSDTLEIVVTGKGTVRFSELGSALSIPSSQSSPA